MGDIPRHIEQAIAYLKRQVGENGVLVLFGSRARGTASRNADYDIGVATASVHEWRTFAVWKTKAEELAWPYRIDVVDLTRAPQEFLDAIRNETVVLHGTWHGHTLATTEA
jgi:predicted nucleotidyltransferase